MPRDGDSTPTVQAGFNQEAAPLDNTPPVETTQDRVEAMQPENDFQSTTSLQLDLEIERHDVLDAHDARWNRERDRLMAKPEEAPSLDLGSDSGRSIQREYEDRRSRWEAHRDSIHRMFDRQVADVRALGTTMSDHFSQAGDQTPVRGQELAAPLSLVDDNTPDDDSHTAEQKRTSVRMEFHREVRKTTRSL